MKLRSVLPAVAILLVIAPPAWGGDHVSVGASDDAFLGSAKSGDTSADQSDVAEIPLPPGQWKTGDACTGGVGKCGPDAICPDGTPVQQTYYQPDTGRAMLSASFCPVRTRRLTTADVDHAFKSIPVDPSPVHIQPPDGETLVNFDSIFYTDPYTEDVTKHLLGVPVAFRITVQHYTWHFGDGATLTTTDPGAAYPHQTLIHRYLTKGPVDVTLETVYQADYSINGGPQTHLADTVTQTSPPQHLTVLTATPHLVAD